MPKKLEQILIAVAVGLFLTIAVGIALRAVLDFVFVFDFKENDLTLGDTFTLMSIIAAGIIAATGWFLARQNRKKEIERIAKAECAIFYHKYDRIHLYAMTILGRIFLDNSDTILNLNEHEIEPSYLELVEHFGAVKKVIKLYSPDFPDTENAHQHLSKVYQYDDELGKLLAEVILEMDQLRSQLGYYEKNSEDMLARVFGDRRESLVQHYYMLLNLLAKIPASFEEIRTHIPNITFNPRIRVEVLEEMRRCFQNIFDIDFFAGDMGSNPAAFYDLFSGASNEFRKIAKRNQSQVIGRLVADGDDGGE